MNPGIFLIRDGNELVELTESEYDSEALLQSLLEQHPNLLAGDQIDSEVPRRWLLVAREASIPCEPDGAPRWSLDHLFLDQDGIPTLVEVKRSSDTRIRREVVGQMLDYAANGAAYWPVDKIRTMLQTRCELAGADPDILLAEFLGPDGDTGDFWQRVKTNLQAGRVRLLFVADRIPSELRRIVEFLNTQMDPAEVLALEVKLYVGQGVRGLVPRVLGKTEQGTQKKSATGLAGARKWDETTFLEELERRYGSDDAGVAGRILKWANAERLELRWGKGPQEASVSVNIYPNGQRTALFAIWTYAKVEVKFGELRRVAPFDRPEARREVQRQLLNIPGVSIADEFLSKYPSFPLSCLRDEGALQKFVSLMRWVTSVSLGDAEYSENMVSQP